MVLFLPLFFSVKEWFFVHSSKMYESEVEKSCVKAGGGRLNQPTFIFDVGFCQIGGGRVGEYSVTVLKENCVEN